MNLSQLQYFKTVVEVNNLTKASHQLYVTQSTLTKSIKRMQDELGGKLFDRDGKKIILNENGRICYEWICDTLQKYDAVKTAVANTEEEPANAINVAISASHFTQPCIFGFMKDNPENIVNEIYFESDCFPQIVQDPEVDVVISTLDLPEKTGNTETAVLCRERLFLMVSAEHPLAGRENCSIHEVDGEEIIQCSQNSLWTVSLEEIYQKAGMVLKTRTGIDRSHIPEAVEQGIGVIIGGRSALDSYRLKGIRIIPLTEDFCERRIYMHCRKAASEKKIVREFRRYAGDFFAMKGVNQ